MDGTNVVNGVMRIELPPASLRLAEESVDTLAPNSAVPHSCYVAGPENRLPAYVLSRLLSSPINQDDFSWTGPLTLVGPSGSGKSYFARAVARRWTSAFGPESVSFFTAKSFALELTMARADNILPEFRSRFAKRRLLVIEDLHKVPTKISPQRELRNLIDTLQDRNLGPGSGTLLFTSQKPLIAIPHLEPGLHDRLAGGLILRLAHPGPDARREICDLASKACGVSLEPTHIASLVGRHGSTPDQILRSVREIAIAPALGENPAKLQPTLSFKPILTAVARHFGLTQTAMRSSSRRKSLVHARSIAIYLARTLTDLSYTELGKQLGNRDHTTIIHAMQNAEQLITEDVTTQDDVNELKRILTVG